MRPNAIGWGLVGFFLIGGLVFTLTIPEIWIGQIWIGVALFLGGLYLLMRRRAETVEQLKRGGIAGQAQILEMTQTGVYVNAQPQVRLRLRVEAPGVRTFEAEKSETVPLIALGMLSSGRALPVYVDRSDQSKFVIDWSGSGPATGAAPATISHQGGAPIDLNANPQARQAVMAILSKHGIDTQGNVDLRQNPTARAAVLDALKGHGVDVAHGVAAADPSTPVGSEKTLDRLQKLMELKNAQLITDEEFQEHKARILAEI
jgi:hypothetical protein